MKIFKMINNKNIYYVIVLCCSLLIIILFGIFCFVPASDSDLVEGVLWADSSIKSGKLLSPDFVYPYAIPFGGNLFILPFVAVFGVSQISNGFGMLLFYIFLIITFFFFIQSLIILFNTQNENQGNDRFSLIFQLSMAMILVLLGYRSQVGDNQFHHLLYYQLGHICFVGIISMVIMLLLERYEKKNWVLLIFYSLWSGANGFIQMILSSIPIICSLLIAFFFFSSNKRIIKQIIVIMSFSSVCGLLINYISMIGINESGYIEKSGSFTFQSISSWIENVRNIVRDWLWIFVRNDPTGKNVLSIQGIEVLLCVFIALVAACVPIVCFLLMLYRRLNSIEIIVFISCFFVFLVCILQFVFFRGGEEFLDGKIEQRLLFNAVLVDFLLITMLFIKYSGSILNQLNRLRFIAGGAIILSLFVGLLDTNAQWDRDNYLLDFLMEKDLCYGFATYWNSNYYTVESSNNIKIRSVDIQNGTITPQYYQSEIAWFERDGLDIDYFFLLLQEDQYNDIVNSMNGRLLELCVDKYEVKNFVILTYPIEDWEEVLFEQGFSYLFMCEEWSIGCKTENNKREIMDGGKSFGPYMSIPADSVCKVTIDGYGLTQSRIRVYSVLDGLELTPMYDEYTNNKVVFSFGTDVNISKLEILIENPVDYFGDSIIIYSESIDVQ
ncbi:hypothetical protein SAMN02910369_02576 [Lachnospiraceae bacterium NE2001]|nr:hypothetical protein SAMN02910369_02576 [Lachnospiraceae bacterium NE2001]